MLMELDWKPPRKTWLTRLTSAFRKPNEQEQTESERMKYRNSLPKPKPPDHIAVAPKVDMFIHIGETCSQEQSLLFSLPREIRQTIYQYVFGPSVIHIESLRDRLAHVTCQQWQSENGWDGHTHCTQVDETGIVSIDETEDPNDQLLAICVTCRQSYLEALTFMLSVPLYTIDMPIRMFVNDNAKLGTLMHIRNLNLQVYFSNFPHLRTAMEYPYNKPGWVQTCQILASMTSLRYLRITILQNGFNRSFDLYRSFDSYRQKRNAENVNELLEPLKSIDTASRGGSFEVVTQGWRVPHKLPNDLPFKVIQERPPSEADLANRSLELGISSQSQYLKMLTSLLPPFHEGYFGSLLAFNPPIVYRLVHHSGETGVHATLRQYCLQQWRGLDIQRAVTLIFFVSTWLV